jgi:hypothetical protein
MANILCDKIISERLVPFPMQSAGGSVKGPNGDQEIRSFATPWMISMNASVGRLLTESNEIFGTVLELPCLCLTWH